MAFANVFQQTAYPSEGRVDDMAEWVKREYSKGDIDRAGKLLIPWWTRGVLSEGLGLLYTTVENWRTSHGLPLNVFQSTLRGRAQRIQPHGVIVAQRLKRFSSIMNKLVREDAMKLSQMQDLGGCRVILSDIRAVTALYETYRGGDLLPPTEGALKCHDYIGNPKPDGYRGIHVVGRYRARSRLREPWNGHRIEIQLRSQLQHVFATAVETVTTFTREPLKFGAGPIEWRRFFSLMGSALAYREETPVVEGTPTNITDLTKELREVTTMLRVQQRLGGWSDALRVLPRQDIREGFKWLLLVLNIKDKTIQVTGYIDRKQASKAVAEIEKSKQEDLDAVLVWVPSINNLRAAYPNYYADTKGFLEALKTALATTDSR